MTEQPIPDRFTITEIETLLARVLRVWGTVDEELARLRREGGDAAAIDELDVEMCALTGLNYAFQRLAGVTPATDAHEAAVLVQLGLAAAQVIGAADPDSEDIAAASRPLTSALRMLSVDSPIDPVLCDYFGSPQPKVMA